MCCGICYRSSRLSLMDELLGHPQKAAQMSQEGWKYKQDWMVTNLPDANQRGRKPVWSTQINMWWLWNPNKPKHLPLDHLSAQNRKLSDFFQFKKDFIRQEASAIHNEPIISITLWESNRPLSLNLFFKKAPIKKVICFRVLHWKNTW